VVSLKKKCKKYKKKDSIDFYYIYIYTIITIDIYYFIYIIIIYITESIIKIINEAINKGETSINLFLNNNIWC
jgi:hypothetical protein